MMVLNQEIVCQLKHTNVDKGENKYWGNNSLSQSKFVTELKVDEKAYQIQNQETGTTVPGQLQVPD